MYTRLTHFYLFCIGWLYYLFIPAYLGFFGMFQHFDKFSFIDNYISQNHNYWQILFKYIIFLLIGFRAGIFFASRTPNVFFFSEGIVSYSFSNLIFFFFCIILCITVYNVKDYLFLGYGWDLDVSLIGPLASLQMIILLQYLIEKSFNNPSARRIGVLLFFSSIFLISLGGRLYVLSSVLAIYIYWWNFSNATTIKRRRSLTIILLIPILLTFCGMWRSSDIDFSKSGFYLFAESIFSSISYFTSFSYNEINLFSFPYDFLASSLNIIPKFIWPNKLIIIEKLSSSSFEYASPMGAKSIVASTIENFGYIGGILYIFLLGFFIEYIGKLSQIKFARALYSYLCALIPFMLFRDPFQIQIKCVLTGFIWIFVNILFFRGSYISCFKNKVEI